MKYLNFDLGFEYIYKVEELDWIFRESSDTRLVGFLFLILSYIF